MWKKRDKEQEPNMRPERIQKMSTHELNEWLNVSLMELGMAYDHWRYKDLPASEVDKLFDIVQNLWAELRDRS